MTGWVALLRGINVGGRNSVPMAELRLLFEQTGCASVSSYIQSGNVLFTHEATGRDALSRQLEQAVHETFGVSSPVVLRTAAELTRIAGSHPFGADASKTNVAFLGREPPPRTWSVSARSRSPRTGSRSQAATSSCTTRTAYTAHTSAAPCSSGDSAFPSPCATGGRSRAWPNWRIPSAEGSQRPRADETSQ
jgi:Protein of unknown function (DUF1697)